MKRQFTPILVFLLSFPIFGHTTTYMTIASGNWDMTSTWDANGIPDPSIAGNTIYINHNVTAGSITTNAAQISINVNLVSGGSLLGTWTNNGSISVAGLSSPSSGLMGTITNNSGGTISIINATVDINLTNYGSVSVTGNTINGILKGTIVNSGTISLNGGNPSIQTNNVSSNSGTITLQDAYLSIGGGDFTNTGIVDLVDATSYIDVTNATYGKFVNTSTGTVKGIGYFVNNYFYTNNPGFIEPDFGGTLRILTGLDLGQGKIKWKLKKETNGTINKSLLTVGDALATGPSYAAFMSLDATASTGSKLNISFDNYNPYIGEWFDIAYIYGNLSGTFNSANVTITGGNIVSSSLTYIANMPLMGTNTIRLTIDAVLPVELMAFKGQNTEGGNLLTWQTATEINNKGFQIERSPQPPKGAFNTWDILGFVNAQGKAGTYTFTDINPLPTSYYRLHQIDNDGKEELSKVISISTKVSHLLKIYPNVVKDILTVETDNTEDFVIVNLLGQQVLRGKTAQRIDVSALPQGAYLLRVGLEVAKFVKE